MQSENIKCDCDRPGATEKVRSTGRAIAHKQSQVPSQLRSPRTPSHYTIAEKSDSDVSSVLTQPHHFVLRTTTCDNIRTAVYIWRVIDVR
ncbi:MULTISPECIES: hypothetical protein [unclassified Microcoleus]|uniref:hypothetical protein n=1 Tax=unclassified Microcoleus TaxID=2642155 RepID=UPI002FCF4143